MKKGKSCSLNGYKKIKCSYGTVDSKNFKSVYLNIQSWVKPKDHYENWDRIISNLNKKIKIFLNDVLDNIMFEPKFIVDLDLRASGISLKKKSFMNLEITFFIKGSVDFKSIRLKNSLKNIVDEILSEIFNNHEVFTFHLTKTNKILKLQDS
jgi:hypothetical protein